LADSLVQTTERTPQVRMGDALEQASSPPLRVGPANNKTNLRPGLDHHLRIKPHPVLGALSSVFYFGLP
jgi:hypothetical protein